MISAAFLALLAASAAPAAPACPPAEPASAVHAATDVARCPVETVVTIAETPSANDLSQPAIFRSEGRNRAILAATSAAPIV